MIYVYILQMETGPIKVGVAWHPPKRLQQFRSYSPYEIRLVDYIASKTAKDDEALLLARLAQHRLRGEWFDNHPQVARRLDEYFGRQLDIQVRRVTAPLVPLHESPRSGEPGVKVVRRELASGEIREYRYQRVSQRRDRTENVLPLSQKTAS